MAKAKIHLDQRESSKTKSGFPLGLQISHRTQTRFIPFQVWLLPSHVVKSEEGVTKVKGVTDSSRLNALIQKRLSDTNYLFAMEDYSFRTKSINEVKAAVLRQVFGLGEESANFVEFSEGFINQLLEDQRPGGTIEWYMGSAKSFHKFLKGKNMALNRIDVMVLERYKASLRKENLASHTINDYLRGLRALLNHAIKQGELDRGHRPFEEFKIPKGKASKGSLTQSELDAIRKEKYMPGTVIWHQKNYFLFMFNNRGMNFVDMAKLKVSQIVKGRLDYNRTKLTEEAVRFSIELTDESKEILSYYLSGKKPYEYIFPILPADIEQKSSLKFRKVKQQALKQLNKYLKVMAADCDIEINMTSYVARHTWSSIARKLGYNIDTIGSGLGHTSNNTTKMYLQDFDLEVLDEMNQKITG